MNQEIINKLHTALYTISPLASDRERIIAQMGETIWVVSFEKMVMSLDENTRKEAIAALNEDNVERAIEIFEANNIDINAIISEVSTSVMDEVLAASNS